MLGRVLLSTFLGERQVQEGDWRNDLAQTVQVFVEDARLHRVSIRQFVVVKRVGRKSANLRVHPVLNTKHEAFDAVF